MEKSMSRASLVDEVLQDFLGQEADVAFPSLAFRNFVNSQCKLDDVFLGKFFEFRPQQNVILASVGINQVNLGSALWKL